MKRKWWIWLIALAAMALLAAVALDQRLIVREYVIEAEEITEPVRLAVLTDLHGCDYGPYGAELAATVDAYNPDAILLAGDMFSADGDYMDELQLFRLLNGITYTYYVTGNHEYWEYDVPHLMSWVESTGVRVLDQSSVYLFIDGQELNICGVPDPYAMNYADAPATEEQLTRAAEGVEEGVYTVLLAHRPELAETYAANGSFDLVLSGHAHGGQVRIPGLVNGLCAPNQGWFPKYAGGEYRVGDMAMIVSRGLSRQAQWFVPRVFNRPELVIVELK